MRDYKKHAYVYSSDLYCEGDYEINGNDDHIYKGWHTYLNLPFPGCFIELGSLNLNVICTIVYLVEYSACQCRINQKLKYNFSRSRRYITL